MLTSEQLPKPQRRPRTRSLVLTLVICLLIFLVWYIPSAYLQEKYARDWLNNPNLRATTTITYFGTRGGHKADASCTDLDSLRCLSRMAYTSRDKTLVTKGAENYEVLIKLSNGRKLWLIASVRSDGITLWDDQSVWLNTIDILDLPLPNNAPDKLRNMCQFLSTPSNQGQREF